MIKGKGQIRKVDGCLFDEELRVVIGKLPDNQEFEFLIVNRQKNRALPSLTYLFSVVLPQIAEQLPDHPPKEALYRYFEDLFAPLYNVTINGKEYEYSDLKREKSLIIDNFTEKVVNFAQKKWGITVMSSQELQDAKNAEYYSEAYKDLDVSWTKFLSHRNNNDSQDERRNQKD